MKDKVVTVNGFKVSSVNMSKDKVKIVLMAQKDEITAGVNSLGEILKGIATVQLAEHPIQFGVLMTEEE